MYAVICTQFKMAALLRKSLETAGRRFSVYIYDVKPYFTSHSTSFFLIVNTISLKCSTFDFYRAFRSKLGGKVGLYGRHKWCEMYAVIFTQFKMTSLSRNSLETALLSISIELFARNLVVR